MGKTGKKQTEKKRLKCEYVQASGTYNCAFNFDSKRYLT